MEEPVDRRRKVELFEEIRREYEFGVGTIKGVAKKLGVHRRMVRQAVGNAVPPDRKRPERKRPRLASVAVARVGRRSASKPAIRVATDSEAKPANEVTTDYIRPFSQKTPIPLPPSQISTSDCEPFREAIELGLSRGRNAMGIWQDLVTDHG